MPGTQMTVAIAISRLEKRRIDLLAEVDRITQSRTVELRDASRQIAAIDAVLAALANPVQAAATDSLLNALGRAGLNFTLTE